MKLIIIRHGESKHNLGSEQAHTFAGSQVDTSLTESGQETAKILADQLKDKQITLIVSSSLKRSKETAEIIKQELGLEKDIIVLPELNEFNVGDFAGRTEEGVKQLFPDPAKDFYDGEIEKWAFPDGENFFDVNKRLDSALEKIKKIARNKTILIVGHGMINRVLFYKLDQNNVGNWQERAYPHDKIVELEVK